MPVELARDCLVGRTRNGFCLPLWKPTGRAVDQRRRLLNVAVGVIDALGHVVIANREVAEAALRLRTPVPVGRDLDTAHRVGLVALTGGVDANWYTAQDR